MWQVGHSVAITSAPQASAVVSRLSTSLVEVSLSDSVCAPPQQAVFSGYSTFSAPAAANRSSMKCGLEVDSEPGPWSFSGKMWRGRVYMQP